MLFENSPWAGTVIKLLMTTLFFISELIFREITWWWTKPEWWPGRRNSLVSEIKVASSGDLESFIGTHCFFSVAWPNPPEHSLEAGGGWWRLVAGHLTTPDACHLCWDLAGVGLRNSWEVPLLYWGHSPRIKGNQPWDSWQEPSYGRLSQTSTPSSFVGPAFSAAQRLGGSDPACVFFLESTLVFLGHRPNLQQWCPKKPINKIVFCEGLLCFQRGFGVMFLHPNVKS